MERGNTTGFMQQAVRMMRFAATTLVVGTLTIVLSGCCQEKAKESVVDHTTLPDTQENRLILADQYFRLVPFHSMMRQMGDEMAAQVPPESKESFQRYWDEFMQPESLNEIEDAARQSFAKHMSVAELAAFVKFIEDPAGRSAMDKMKLYMGDVMPLIQQKAVAARAAK